MNAVVLVPVAGRDDVVASVLARVADTPLLVHCLRGLLRADRVERIVVVTESSEVDKVLVEFGLADTVSVLSGPLIEVWTTVSTPDVDVVLVHDPLRAFTPPELVDSVVAAVLASVRPVVPVLPCSDTVKRVDDDDAVLDTPDRAGLRVAQTPVGYPAAAVTSTTLGLVPLDALTVAGDPAARRLAGPVDLAMMGGELA